MGLGEVSRQKSISCQMMHLLFSSECQKNHSERVPCLRTRAMNSINRRIYVRSAQRLTVTFKEQMLPSKSKKKTSWAKCYSYCILTLSPCWLQHCPIAGDWTQNKVFSNLCLKAFCVPKTEMMDLRCCPICLKKLHKSGTVFQKQF